jgi:hypothetical protein
MAECPTPFVTNPGIDFTRNRKLPFDKMLLTLLLMGGNSIKKELLDLFSYDPKTATTPAFAGQREKILPFSFEYLLEKTLQLLPQNKKFTAYRLLAVDGSNIHPVTNQAETTSFVQPKSSKKGYNLLHLNALYDLCNRVYVDALVQPYREMNENEAFVNMIKRSKIGEQIILIADRGYESFNNFAHLAHKGWNYVIRVKDVNSNGILAGLDLPSDGEFDIWITLILTRKQAKEIKSQPKKYRILDYKSTFDFLDSDTNLFYPITFRVVRFKLDNDNYEAIITNLDSSTFSPHEVKTLYNMRWGIETSFRALKYTIGLTNFHAKKQKFVIQEIFARIIMYNLAEMTASQVVIQQEGRKYEYKVNFTVVVYVCRLFLRITNNVHLSDAEGVIRANILPIRPNRGRPINESKIRGKSAVSFNYRVA